MKRYEYSIDGMRCSGCTASVTKKLSSLEGVTSVNVNLLTGLCVVMATDDFDSNSGISAINQVGFKASLANDKTATLKNDYYYKTIEMIISVVFSVLILIVTLSNKVFSLNLGLLNMNNHPIVYSSVLFVLSIPVIIVGLRFFIPGYRLLFKGHPNMDSLVSLSSSVAFVYSVVYFIIMLVQNNYTYAGKIIFEASTMVIAFSYVGKFIEQQSKNKARDSIGDLLDVLPTNANIVKDGQEISLCVNEIDVGDIIIVRQGQRIPVDGVVLNGEGTIDNSSLTGESKEVYAARASKVFGGGILLTGTLQIKASKLSSDASINNILRLVSESQLSKTATAQAVDVISRYFIPVVLLIAFLTAVIWGLFIKKGLDFTLTRTISVLVVACPCSIGLAIPMANVLSSNVALKNGFVYKNISIVEKAKKISLVLFDKTGTLSTGAFEVLDIKSYDKLDMKDIISITASLENNSNHPIAESIKEYAKNKNSQIFDVLDYKYIGQKGVSGIINNKTYYFGNDRLMSSLNIEVEDNSCLYLADERALIASWTIADEIAKGSKELVSFFKNKGIDVVMLTGDNENSAKKIADKLGITMYKAQLMPKDKIDFVKEQKSLGKSIMFIGDGVNDAPALTEAEIGISPYGSSDVAADSSDIYLLNDNLENIKTIFNLSKYTFKIIKLNLLWAFLYNIVGIFVAAGVLYNLNILLSPWMSSAIMMISSVSVILSSMSIIYAFRKKS